MSVTDTRRVVQEYFEAWTRKDVPRARTYLADDLDFQGPIDRFTRADPFAQALAGFAQLLKEVRLLASLFGEQDAMLLYDCVTASPAGTIRTAEHFRLRGGKIAEIKLVFDATELRKVMAGGK
jgi:hypothetical protein